MAQTAEQQTRVQLRVFIDKSIHRTIKAYAAETDQTIADVLKKPMAYLEQEAIKIAGEVELMKIKAMQKKLQEEEDHKLSTENPIGVSGKTEDPIGTPQIEPRAF